MKYDGEETKEINPKTYILIIVALSTIIIILLGIIVMMGTSKKTVDCSEECKKIETTTTKTDSKEEDNDKEQDKDDDKKPSSKLEISIDTSYKITPNLPNMDLSFASTSCTLIDEHYQKNKIDKTKSHTITIKNIALNGNNHRYKYVIDTTNNINIELFDNEYISTKDTSKYLLTKICNYNNHVIVIENDINEPINSLIKIIDSNGEVKYYKDNIIDVAYEDDLLYISLVNKDKYERISIDLNNKLAEETIEKEDVECDNVNASQPNLTSKEKDIIKYCELKEKSLN